MPQWSNEIKQKERQEIEFNINAGNQESNVVDCKNKSLFALLMPNNIEGDNVELLVSNDKNFFYPLSWDDRELGFSSLQKPYQIKYSFFPNSYGFTELDTSGVFFKPDGTQMFVSDINADKIQAYNLLVPWDVNTAVLNSSIDISNEISTATDVFFKPDGTQMFAIGFSTDFVYAYNLSTPWDITTAKAANSFDVAGEEASPRGLTFKPDGSKMFVSGHLSGSIQAYNLSTSWDITTAKASNSIDISSETNTATAVFFRPDGTKMFILEGSVPLVYSYDLSTAWDITTASLKNTFDASDGSNNGRGLFFAPDGGRMFIISGSSVFGYNLSTEWDISSNISLNLFSVSDQDGIPGDVFFKPDGSKMFVVGTNSNNIFCYDLSKAWDITTAVLNNSFGVPTNPTGVFFKPDGTKMFIVESSSLMAHSYNLSTAWDISSSSIDNSYDFSSQLDGPRDIFFKPDGSKMFVVENSNIAGNNQHTIYSYNLSTAWDITTANFVNSLDERNQVPEPTGVFFKPDGSKMFVVGANSNIHSYNLVIAWDIDSVNVDETFSVKGLLEEPTGLFFISKGNEFFVVGAAKEAVYRFFINRPSWVSIAYPPLTKPYRYLKLKSSVAENGDRTIKGIIGA